jgi:RNA polymerase sigma factor (sigma-70 family)
MMTTQRRLMQTTGKELVERAKRKDAQAFAALIRQHERVALSVAFGVIGDANAAGDVVQDAFIRSWDRLSDLREPERFATWLCGIVRNLSVDYLRRRKPAERLGDHKSPVAEKWTHDPLTELDQRERRQGIHTAVMSLDEISRPVVVLRYYEGLASREIADLLELTPAAVDMRLSRARKQLRLLLDDSDRNARKTIENSAKD